jgi:protein involved in polysaccharide export with SLBB domain
LQFTAIGISMIVVVPTPLATQDNRPSPRRADGLAAVALLVLSMVGCVSHRQRIPAKAVHNQTSDVCRGQDEPINFLMLRQDPPKSYRLGPRDVLGIYIEGILGDGDTPPPVHFPDDESQQPAIGYPVPVRDNGTISLPLIPPIDVAGMTLPQVERAVHARYCDSQILRESRQRIIVTLMKRRTYQIMVVREDQGLPVSGAMTAETLVLRTNKRGMSYAIDLAAYENDVLRALSKTGGLPGNDAKNEIVILRGAFDPERLRQESTPQLVNPVSGEEIEFDDKDVGQLPEARIEAVPEELPPGTEVIPATPQGDVVTEGDCPDCLTFDGIDEYLATHGDRAGMIRIPLRIGPEGGMPRLRKQDVILKTGDVVFVPSRETEVYYTGGLLPGGQHPLPRDYQIDVLEAIAMAGASVGAAVGTNSSQVSGAATPGAVFPATRVVILRRRGHRQVPIEVDVRHAFSDPRERIKIEPGDFITLEYRPAELVGNLIMSTLRFNFLLNAFD